MPMRVDDCSKAYGDGNRQKGWVADSMNVNRIAKYSFIPSHELTLRCG